MADKAKYENRHHVTCPSCDADFVAEGEAPLATNCPVCGVTGFIRPPAGAA
jgi:predicted RNA-binding Zn-ribbon protein involved in translation (DUF1610 family)